MYVTNENPFSGTLITNACLNPQSFNAMKVLNKSNHKNSYDMHKIVYCLVLFLTLKIAYSI